MLKSKILSKKVLLFTLLFALFSCANGKFNEPSDKKIVDREANLTAKDFREGLIKTNKKEEKDKAQQTNKSAPIPSISRLALTLPPPKIGGNKTISFSVTNQVPLKDVLIELGRVAKIDVDIDPNVSGGIILNAKNRPLKEVIDRIASLGQLRYSYDNNVLSFEKDTPYSKNYFVDFLSGSQLWGDVELNLTALLADSETGASDLNPLETARSSISSNKSAGILSIYATRKQHKNVSKYLDAVYKVASAQVLIEAKVVEVTLKDEYAAGIDWNWADTVNSFTTSSTAATNNLTNPALTATTTSLLGIGGNLAATVKALEKFGTARAISSPRISAINNQEALLDFSEELVYFTLSTTSVTTPGTVNLSTINTVTATKNEVPVGVKLIIIPSINLSTQEITLDIRPTLSINSGQVAVDPSVNPLTGLSLGNTIPIIRTREIKTIAKVQTGSILVIGGLMTETATNEDIGIPLLSEIPYLGRLFQYSSRSSEIIETVIFVKASIVNNGAPPSKYDREFHDKFTVDPKLFLQ